MDSHCLKSVALCGPMFFSFAFHKTNFIKRFSFLLAGIQHGSEPSWIMQVGYILGMAMQQGQMSLNSWKLHKAELQFKLLHKRELNLYVIYSVIFVKAGEHTSKIVLNLLSISYTWGNVYEKSTKSKIENTTKKTKIREIRINLRIHCLKKARRERNTLLR